ncbi:hypothetical protein [Iningainema tapete]|uniref:Uncharacterized protein n=1 Tax=Iningainema tapete BLCC-T55 TaxID=2748662 RepID=A0A8J7C5N3_9CYAN|nr:hypothetical protein [Iningainema tapete]MBD2771031.1 hypothetical protein [Iningainema tapete BLCC-T55]
MSAVNLHNPHSEGRKVHISLMLKMPIDIELELSVMPSTIHSKVEGNSESAVVISNQGQPELEHVQLLSNQILNQLVQACQVIDTPLHQKQNDLENNQQDSTVTELKSKDTLLAQEQAIQEFTPPKGIQQLTSPIKEKPKGRLLDLLKDSFTLSVNSVGTILFLG